MPAAPGHVGQQAAPPSNFSASIPGPIFDAAADVATFDVNALASGTAFRSALADAGPSECKSMEELSRIAEQARQQAAAAEARADQAEARVHQLEEKARRQAAAAEARTDQAQARVQPEQRTCQSAPSSHSANDVLGAAIEPAWVVWARDRFIENEEHREQHKNAKRPLPAPWPYSRMIDTIRERFQHLVSERSLCTLKKGKGNVGAKRGRPPKDPEDRQAALKVWPLNCSTHVFACACVRA